MDKDVDFSKLVAGSSKNTKGVGGSECHLFGWLQVKSIDEGARQITALASTGTLDRDGDIVPPEVIKQALPGYMQNPVILAAHKQSSDTGHSTVVGRTVRAWVDKQGLWVTIEFVKGTALGEEYWILYSQKVQRAFSIGYRVLESHGETVDGKRANVFDEMELYEISCVAIPANPEALSKARKAKQDFIAAQRMRRESRRIEAELAADPDMQRQVQEYADALMNLSGDDKDWRCDDMIAGDDVGYEDLLITEEDNAEDFICHVNKGSSGKVRDRLNGFYDEDDSKGGANDVMEFAALVKGRERGYYERLDWEKMEKGFKLPSRS